MAGVIRTVDPTGEKVKARRAGDIETAVGRIVVHVALPGMGLAPGVLMRSDVLRFGVIGRARIQRRVQVVLFHQKPVRRACVSVAGVVRLRVDGKAPVNGFTQAREPRPILDLRI